MTLSAKSAAALARLRAFRPPPSTYPTLPLARRAAVLILLFADPRGSLRVVLTIRSATLRNYAGHAALPGGKADSDAEDAWATARREAAEEIGLPEDDGALAKGGWELEQLAELPANLAVTELGVRPCVGFLKRTGKGPGAELLPTLDAREVEAVFTAPLEGFLRTSLGQEEAGVPGKWYQGSWTDWHQERWRMHQFFVPKGTVYRSSEDSTDGGRFRVFGMTARILVDAARVAYGEEPEFEHNSHFGDEDMIRRLVKIGRLGSEKRENDGLTKEVMREAKRTKL